MDTDFEVGDDVLVVYPGFGSLWGTVTERYDLEGRQWFNMTTLEEWSGNPYLKDGCHWEEITMNFPATCVRRASRRQEAIT